MNQAHDHGIDLAEILKTLWDGKWLISAFAVLATVTGFGYSQIAQPKYDVSVSHVLESTLWVPYKCVAATFVV